MKITNFGENMEKPECLCTIGKNIKWHSDHDIQNGDPQNTKI